MSNKVPSPKVSEIVPGPEFRYEVFDSHPTPPRMISIWNLMWRIGLVSCEMSLKQHKIKEWVKSAEIDLVIIDALYNECGFGIAYKLKAKTILFSTMSPTMGVPDIFGNSPESSWIPDMQYHYEEPMSFTEKVYTTLAPLYWHFWVHQFNYLPQLEGVIRKELDLPEMPSIQELEKNTSLIFLNTHFSSEYARSLPPVYVPVGGIHLVESNQHELPQDMRRFLDESGLDGVVYVSFGTFANASLLDLDLKESIFHDVFEKFESVRFIWRCDLKLPVDNIMTVNWAPQQEILAHKKVKAFVSHGGLLSVTEAAYYPVPLIIFPIFADQGFNANLVVKNGHGMKLDINGVTREELHGALTKILTENKYKSKATKVSKLFRGRPIKPLETAVWWTEYVLRHKDTSSLKPLSVHQTWFQRRLLDVWLFILLSVLFSFSVIVYIIFKCVSVWFCHRGQRATVTVDNKVKRA